VAGVDDASANSTAPIGSSPGSRSEPSEPQLMRPHALWWQLGRLALAATGRSAGGVWSSEELLDRAACRPPVKKP
jgi:hypothetical protein